MANFYTAQGTKFFFSNTFSNEKYLTEISNADPAIGICANHGLAKNDEILLTSRWEESNGQIFRLGAVSDDTMTMEGFDSTDANIYPPDTNTGSVKKVEQWTEIPGIIGIETSGGDQKFIDVQLLSSQYASKIPDGFEAATATLTMAHDPEDPVYQEMLKITRTGGQVAFKILLKNGASILSYGYLSASETPKMNAGEVNQVTVTLAFQRRLIAYGKPQAANPQPQP